MSAWRSGAGALFLCAAVLLIINNGEGYPKDGLQEARPDDIVREAAQPAHLVASKTKWDAAVPATESPAAQSVVNYHKLHKVLAGEREYGRRVDHGAEHLAALIHPPTKSPTAAPTTKVPTAAPSMAPTRAPTKKKATKPKPRDLTESELGEIQEHEYDVAKVEAQKFVGVEDRQHLLEDATKVASTVASNMTKVVEHRHPHSVYNQSKVTDQVAGTVEEAARHAVSHAITVKAAENIGKSEVVQGTPAPETVKDEGERLAKREEINHK